MRLDYTKIEDVEVDGIDTSDYPDFCDAYIATAKHLNNYIKILEVRLCLGAFWGIRLQAERASLKN